MSIQSGNYTIGSGEGIETDEAPSHLVPIEPFEIGAFPVTNGEWGLFMAAGGYEDERWWITEAAQAWRRGEGTHEGAKKQYRENRRYVQEHRGALQGRAGWTSVQIEQWEHLAGLGDEVFERRLDEWFSSGRKTQPLVWDDESFKNPAQPVVGICWHEARAYCAWLSGQTYRLFRLPTEGEWEAAARGKEGRAYAYGREFDATKCNTFESHIGRTTPIDVFPGGRTAPGVADLTGNTWEWTSTLHQPYAYNTGDGRENPAVEGRRVVRGGSWDLSQRLARAVHRSSVYPDGCSSNLGFRLVRSSPISQ